MSAELFSKLDVVVFVNVTSVVRVTTFVGEPLMSKDVLPSAEEVIAFEEDGPFHVHGLKVKFGGREENSGAIVGLKGVEGVVMLGASILVWICAVVFIVVKVKLPSKLSD